MASKAILIENDNSAMQRKSRTELQDASNYILIDNEVSILHIEGRIEPL